MQILPTVCAVLYFLGAFLYYIHQLTILYFKETENVSETKVLTNAVIWPWRVVEILVMYVVEMNRKDDEDHD
jgi:hypothetical protein